MKNQDGEFWSDNYNYTSSLFKGKHCMESKIIYNFITYDNDNEKHFFGEKKIFLNSDIVFTSYIVYFGFIFLVCKFEKEKKVFKKKRKKIMYNVINI